MLLEIEGGSAKRGEAERSKHLHLLHHLQKYSTPYLVIASTITYPIVVMRTVMFDFRGHEKAHFLSTVKHILSQSGVRGFYAGLKPDLIRLIPSNAILFIVYEKSKAFL